MILFETPVSKTKVRNGIFAYKFRNGVVQIESEKYFFYSVKDAIKNWRLKN